MFAAEKGTQSFVPVRLMRSGSVRSAWAHLHKAGEQSNLLSKSQFTALSKKTQFSTDILTNLAPYHKYSQSEMVKSTVLGTIKPFIFQEHSLSP